MNKLMVSLALALASCAQIFGVDDFEVAPPDAGLGAEVFADKGPYLAGETCQACVKANCADANAACAADSTCTQLFKDKREHPGPVADYRRRLLPPLADQLWHYDHGMGANPYAAVDPRAECIETYCADACQIGRDFSCVGNFDWPAIEAGPKKLRVSFADETRKTDYDVEFCLSISPCTGGSVHGQTDSRGFAELIIETPNLPFGFSGFIAANTQDPDSYPFTFILRSGPIESDLYIREGLLSKREVDPPYTALGGAVLGPELGTVWVNPTDCNGNKARHVVVESSIASAPGQGFQPCTDCVPTIYTGDTNNIDPKLKELASLGGRALLTSLPPRMVLVVVRDTITRRVLAGQALQVRGGFVHVMHIYPASRRELSGLPTELAR